jgi:plasmid stabilization system protein ParE
VKRAVRLSAGAIHDLARLPAYVEVDSPATAERVRACLQAAIASLDEFAERGRPGPEAGLRELVAPFGRAAYIV